MLEEFIKFIKGDHIMLGLSCAIVFLVFIFILVLIFGGKKKKKTMEDKVEDNTGALLKSDLETEPLKSTQEFSLNLNIEENKPSMEEIPNPVQTAPVLPFEAPQVAEPVEEVMPIPVTNEVETPVVNEDTLTLQPRDVTVTQTVVLPTLNEVPKVEPQEVISQPSSSTNIESSLPETPAVEETTNDNVDDIELPMLNKNEDTSVLSSLEGEHYNI